MKIGGFTMGAVLLIAAVAYGDSDAGQTGRRHHKLVRRAQEVRVAPNRYLVVLTGDGIVVQDDVPSNRSHALVDRYVPHCGTVSCAYETLLRGFALDGCSEEELSPLLDDSTVLYAVEVRMIATYS
jgi:hypothetical protein